MIYGNILQLFKNTFENKKNLYRFMKKRQPEPIIRRLLSLEDRIIFKFYDLPRCAR